MLQAPQRYLNFIGNELKPADSGETIPVVDPSNGETFASIPRSRAGDVARAVHAARGAFEGAWGRFSAMERSRLLMRLAGLVDAHREELAQLESRDTGKPLKQGRADAQALSRYFEYYAGAADKLHGQTIPYQTGYTVLTCLLYTSPSPRDRTRSRMPSSA